MVSTNQTDGHNKIFVAGPGRCGTSLVTGLFASMGAWTGRARIRPSEKQPRGFYENVEFRQAIRLYMDRHGLVADARQGWQDIPIPSKSDRALMNRGVMLELRRDTQYQGGPAVFKNPLALYTYPALFLEFPAATWVVARRPIEQIVRSQMAAYGGDEAQWIDWAERYYRTFSGWASENTNVFVVDVEELYNLEDQAVFTMEALCARVGMNWSEERARDFIVPGRLHV